MDPRYPVGKFSFDKDITPEKRAAWISDLAALPTMMRAAVALLPASSYDTPYREGGWTVRQVVHHVADSHMNAYIRVKNALAEDNPVIKPYEETVWAEMPDGKRADPQVSLAILDGVHQRLVMLLGTLTEEQFARPTVHPASGQGSVDWLLQMYAWHSRHHVAHVRLVT